LKKKHFFLLGEGDVGIARTNIGSSGDGRAKVSRIHFDLGMHGKRAITAFANSANGAKWFSLMRQSYSDRFAKLTA
jgi:hypothetical protein